MTNTLYCIVYLMPGKSSHVHYNANTTIMSIGQQGMDVACSRTTESFSPCDHTSWLRQIHAAYKSNLEEKSTSLERIMYTSGSVREVIAVWEREPEEIRGRELHCSQVM